MSLIHWDKSVLSFHLKEIIEDGHGNNPVALAGLSVIAASSLLVPAVTKLGRPFLKAAIKNSLASTVGLNPLIATVVHNGSAIAACCQILVSSVVDELAGNTVPP